jgi:hypothetical protein
MRKKIPIGFGKRFTAFNQYEVSSLSPPRPSIIRQAIREVLTRAVCKGDR